MNQVKFIEYYTVQMFSAPVFLFLSRLKTLQELGKELQRQRQNNQDFLADTRSLEMESNSLRLDASTVAIVS